MDANDYLDTIDTIEIALNAVSGGYIKDYTVRVGRAKTLITLWHVPAYHDAYGDIVDERFALRMGGHELSSSEGLCDHDHDLRAAAHKVYTRLSRRSATIEDQDANAPRCAFLA